MIGFLNILPESIRFKCLGYLLERCPYMAIRGLIIHFIKQQIVKYWPSSSSSSSSIYFASPKVLDLFPFFINFTDPAIGAKENLMEKLDVIMNALNLYRFLLLRDKNLDVIGIWKPESKELVRTKFLDPLKLQLDEKLKKRIYLCFV